MPHDTKTLKDVKAEAKDKFGDVPGVQGFGVGDDVVRVYVLNAEVGKRLPQKLHGVRLERVPVGNIVAR